MVKKKRSGYKSILNRRARFDYELGDTFTVGMQLSGAETKSLRMGHGHLRGAFVIIKDNELWLINSTINGAPGITIDESDQTRARKLLARRKEIDKLIQAKNDGLAIIPLEIHNHARYIKLKISIGRGKKRYDKREIIKKRQEKRNIDIVIKGGN